MNIQPYFEQQGSGPPIVFIHGSFASYNTWKKYCEQLSNKYLCISIKLPGHGGAPPLANSNPADISGETALIKQIVTSLSDQPAHIVGHSYGAVVALALALENTLALSKLSLFEPVSGWLLQYQQRTQAELTILNQFVADYKLTIAQQQPQACAKVIDFWGGENSYASLPEFIQNSMPPLTQLNIKHWQQCMALSYNLRDLSQLNIATQVIYGDQSNPILKTIAQLITEHTPHSQIHCIAGASHFLVNSHSDACINILQQPINS
ncbi:alpha/beta hydrolase [Dasania sp. GY-MA-18]|uniref:Alpha/beta hydrolase n=1 Tax=Dasania phycosphaerae TaxID=2950436 RepID=A0A9J6RK43_9GAMM|nr:MULTISPECIES: alpha/beta hydrolase [Dasania]MCR8922172.1 alpha/beta hydrolase [Dasania sp. GY-MA-18]MCZ0864600.1 alpha/beta hydrolase [Dasania phycosphaerae]MCZ0868328.1 alpha/beta hydrolase [Dasania phycosphaerae]